MKQHSGRSMQSTLPPALISSPDMADSYHRIARDSFSDASFSTFVYVFGQDIPSSIVESGTNRPATSDLNSKTFPEGTRVLRG